MPLFHPADSQASTASQLIHQISKVLIIAYQESTQRLEEVLIREGLEYKILRQEDQPEYCNFASSYRCMLNHQRAWERAAQESKPTLIVEADFIPVVGLGKLPLPFDATRLNVGIAWLYTCAPQVYSVTPEGYAEGYSTALVAYILTPQAAHHLCDLVSEVTAKWGTGYVTFDSEIDAFLRARSFKNYIAFRNYGEHGGRSNPEHRRNGMSGIHRADVLYGQLAFPPAYANEESRFEFLRARLQARLKGLIRLATGKFVRVKVLKNSSVPGRILSFSIRRQLSPRI